MKKVFYTLLTVVLILTVSFSGLFEIKAEAKTKKKKAVSSEEQQVIDLQAYLNALIAQGAPAEDIEFAQRALASAEAALKAKEQAEAQAKAAEEAAKKASKNAQQPAQVFPIIFVGDSRMVQMHDTVGNTGVFFVAENAKGYNWFRDEAIPQIDAHVGKGTKIVINLGVNDPGNIDSYIALVNAKAIEWKAKGAKVYYATVNPVSENPYTSQYQVDYFNEKLVNGLVGVSIIDTSTFLRTNGYRLVDGLHYDGPTYVSLYNYLLGRI